MKWICLLLNTMFQPSFNVQAVTSSSALSPSRDHSIGWFSRNSLLSQDFPGKAHTGSLSLFRNESLCPVRGWVNSSGSIGSNTGLFIRRLNSFENHACVVHIGTRTQSASDASTFWSTRGVRLKGGKQNVLKPNQSKVNTSTANAPGNMAELQPFVQLFQRVVSYCSFVKPESSHMSAWFCLVCLRSMKPTCYTNPVGNPKTQYTVCNQRQT